MSAVKYSEYVSKVENVHRNILQDAKCNQGQFFYQVSLRPNLILSEHNAFFKQVSIPCTHSWKRPFLSAGVHVVETIVTSQ